MQDGAADTLAGFLEERAARRGDAPALLGPGQRPLSFRALRDSAAATRAALRAAGVGPADRVALVLPDGPVLAAAFLGTAAAAAAAPLNPALGEAECESLLGDLRAAAILLPAGVDGPARAAAARRGVPILRVDGAAGREAGAFLLGPGEGGAPARPAPDGSPGPADEALVLHTSGTTSRPKQVPLSHRNLRASAAGIARSLGLGPDDRCLGVMPLFHIHGLVGALLASLDAGGSVACAPGFRAPEFFAWVREFRPSWYTAVPTMHQSVLDRVALDRIRPGGTSLRFARSSSAPLPTLLQARLEEALGVPVLQAYGMTEASHQIAVNPLPPATRKPGSVGLPAGTEVAALDGAGRPLGPGAIGEIAVKGPGVTAGYLGDPAARAAAFVDGWFRTGDQGYRDGDGYVFLTGRLKEIVNRGGEKIAPLEVDEALGAHPAVSQALAFAIPHPRLGEDVGAAVVLRPGAAATEAQLREFAAARLAPFKVPARILVVESIPRGPTGKLQRIGLAEVLGVAAPTEGEGPAAAAHREPGTATERRIAEHLRGVLRVDRVGVDHRFEALGMDSLTGLRVADWIRSAFARDFTLRDLLDRGTVAAVAAHLDAGERP